MQISTPAPKTILVVEDNAVQSLVIESILRQEGFEVLKAGSGCEGLKIAHDSRPDVVLLDWELPDSSAPELIGQFLSDPQNRFLPIIVLTGHNEVEKLEIALGKGASDFITKPARKVELLARIKSSLRVRDLQEQLNELSIRDPLTRLYNRRFLDDHMPLEFETCRRYGRALCCGLIDIDFFKKINDTYGHPIGDRVIKQLATLLLSNLRKVDIAARYGGEEFLVLLPETKLEPAVECFNRLLDKARQLEWGEPGNTFKVTFSTGVASTLEHQCESAQQLIDYADLGLYEAKKSGRNRVETYKKI
ncbi:MAG TPA: diguanylate cyclase [Oligoflexus sp.]|uniref:diguanylate cyclase n=1 Tax=Oligoflexus sp. TaxID=1971216 RepID=UPI002D4A6EB5|nr:diguanylate cyclase [Oligoflexus sp.]HYX31475.1 diguanylate cyclase [Oligoflexus sp.]